MKRKKKILIYSLSALLTVAVIVVANVMRSTSVVKGLTVNIDYQGCEPLVTSDELSQLIYSEYEGVLSKRVMDVKSREIARIVRHNCYVEEARASVSVGGNIEVNVLQRRPIVRIFYNGTEFYADHTGTCFPPSKVGECDVLVGSGDFKTRMKRSFAEVNLRQLADSAASARYDIVSLWRLADYLDRQDFSPLYDQVYVSEKGDLLLIPRIGNHEVEIGSADDLDDKFHRLKLFYAQGLPRVGDNAYKRVSVKYAGQVVCTRRNDK